MSNNATPEPVQKPAKSGRRLWLKALIAVAGILVILLTVATIVQERDTKPAKADIGEIVSLPGGDLQVWEDGKGTPIVLIHGYSASMHWWNRNVAELARSHRVIRIDLLGHGGSEKPTSGYSMKNQAELVASALNEKGVSNAYVVGHSMGGTVATALAEQNPKLVDRITIIGTPADDEDAKLPFLGRLIFVPVLGHGLHAIATKPVVKNGLKSAFAPDYDKIPDQFVEDYLDLNYSAVKDSKDEAGKYLNERGLSERLKKTGKPLLVIFGREDQIVDPAALKKFRSNVPNSKTRYIDDAGHTPQYEKPKLVNRLILNFK